METPVYKVNIDAVHEKRDMMREKFELWSSGGDLNCRSLERSGESYKLMQTRCDWIAWKAAWKTRGECDG
jgi:hypothetical protein